MFLLIPELYLFWAKYSAIVSKLTISFSGVFLYVLNLSHLFMYFRMKCLVDYCW